MNTQRSRLFLVLAAGALIVSSSLTATTSAQDRPAPPANPTAPKPSSAPTLKSAPSGERTATAAAQPAHAMNVPSIEAFMKIRAPGSPTLAPDGTLYVRDWPDGINQLYRLAKDSPSPAGSPEAKMERLTNFPDGLSSYSLSEDGKHIILSAAVGGNEQTQLYHLDPATGQQTDLLINPAVVYGLDAWLDDSSGFIYTANDTSPADFHIYRYDFATKKSTKLLGNKGQWNAADITPDGSRLLINEYISASISNAYELDVKTGTLTKLNIGKTETSDAAAGYMPGYTAAMIISDSEDGIHRLFVRDLKTNAVTKPFPDLDAYPVEGGTMNHERTIGAVTVNEGGYGSMRLFALPDFKEIPLPAMEKGIIGAVRIRENMLTYTINNARQPGIAYSWAIHTKAMPKQLTVADTQGIDLKAFPLPQLITYSSFDGTEIPAFVYTPPSFKPGMPIPFVVNYHGGPEGQSRPTFTALIQFLVANGYGVMLPNVRGSSGYGTKFQMMDNIEKRWDSVKDGVEAARWLVKNGYAQEGRIAAYGGSYGGFMSVATILEGPDVFGSSINVVGIVNFKTFLEQTKDYRRKLREVEYGSLEDEAFLKTISPIHRVDEIKIPMMIAHGLNDPRVPVGEAMQLATSLQKRGYDPELLFFADEGHGFAKLENRLLFAKRMVKFLERTIGD